MQDCPKSVNLTKDESFTRWCELNVSHSQYLLKLHELTGQPDSSYLRRALIWNKCLFYISRSLSCILGKEPSREDS